MTEIDNWLTFWVWVDWVADTCTLLFSVSVSFCSWPYRGRLTSITEFTWHNKTLQQYCTYDTVMYCVPIMSTFYIAHCINEPVATVEVVISKFHDNIEAHLMP